MFWPIPVIGFWNLCAAPFPSALAVLWRCRNRAIIIICVAWWLIGRFVAFDPKGCGFKSSSSCHIGTLGKFFTRCCLWRFGGKLRHGIHAVSGAPLSSSGLEKAL